MKRLERLGILKRRGSRGVWALDRAWDTAIFPFGGLEVFPKVVEDEPVGLEVTKDAPGARKRPGIDLVG